MSERLPPEFAGDAIDAENGLIARRIFSDPQIYESEQQRIFGRTWLFLAHEDQLPSAGDYITCKMGEVPVVVVRDAAGAIHALINSCRHRGNQVTRNDCGSARSFMCPYHGWTYDLQGRRLDPGSLVGIPGRESYYHNNIDLEHWGLIPVSQVSTYGGLIFGNFDPSAPSLDAYLGDFRWFLDILLKRGTFGAVPGVARWHVDCNWKFATDNGIGDNAHGQIAHRSAAMAIAHLRGEPTQIPHEDASGFTILTEYGHGANCKLGPAEPPSAQKSHKLRSDPVFERWRDNPEITRAFEPMQLRVQRYNANVFPNLFIIDRVLVVRNPISPTKTEMRAIALFDKNGDAQAQEAEKRLAFQKFGPGGFYEQEDGENWDQATLGARIRELQDRSFNYGMAIGDGEFISDGQSPPRIESMTNEHAQIWFYKFWADALAADDWDALRSNHSKPRGRL